MMDKLESIKLSYRIEEIISNFQKEDFHKHISPLKYDRIILKHPFIIWNSDFHKCIFNNNVVNECLCIIFGIDSIYESRVSLSNMLSTPKIDLYVYDEFCYVNRFPMDLCIGSYLDLIDKTIKIIDYGSEIKRN